MNKVELRVSINLALVYGLRMLGMFLILPIFVIYAQKIPGGENTVLVGMALGAYGLTQAIFQLPLGMWSDKIGRKPVIYLGLGIFAGGSLVCAWAPDMIWMIIGRSLQGAGAISAALTALLADVTREESRTKAMAIIGLSIAMTFALSLVLGPLLSQWIGLEGLFILTSGLALLAMLSVAKGVPNPKVSRFHADVQTQWQRLGSILKHRELQRLYLGIFILHASQMALFVVLPLLIEKVVDLPITEHWHIYLPVVLGSFILMAPVIIWGEKANKVKQTFIASIFLLFAAQLGFAEYVHHTWSLLLILLIYFIGFNVLEATLPSLISKIAPLHSKGTAMGVYNTSQSLGIFLGGVLSGWLCKYFDSSVIFIVCALAALLWFGIAITMQTVQAIKTTLLYIDEDWQGNIEQVSDRLANLYGVKEVAVMIDERVIYLRVDKSGWDEAAAKLLILETKNGIVK